MDDDKEKKRLIDEPKATNRLKLTQQIDFLSEDFNPELVLNLREDQLNLPVPNAKLFNNLDEYALKSFPQSKKTASNSAEPTDLDILRKQQAIRERMKEQIQLLDSKRTKKQENCQSKTVLNLMCNHEFLGRFIEKRLRIFMRRRRQSRHPCEQYACLFGQLIFFDRHWNLILTDVIEIVQFVNDQSNSEVKSDELSNLNKEMMNSKNCLNDQVNEQKMRSNLRIEQFGMSTSLISLIGNRRLLIGKNSENSLRISVRERHFTRLFIRGDNVIYISKV